MDNLTSLNYMIKEYKDKNKIICIFHLASLKQLQFIVPIINLINKEYVEIKYLISTFHKYDYSNFNSYLKNENEYIYGDIVKELDGVDFFLQTEIYGRGPKNAKKIFIGHGQPNKWTYWSKENLKSFEHYFLYGELEKEMFSYIQEKNPKDTKHIKLHKIGYPKLDDQLNNKYSKDEIYSKYNLDKNKKTIIYSPAWDPGGSLRENGINIIKALLETKTCNIIVKLHPVSLEAKSSPHFNFYTGGKVWEEEFKIFKNYENFYYIKDSLINPLLFVSDIMITDFSGVSLEFMCMNKPVIFIDAPTFYTKTQKKWGNDTSITKNDDRFNAGRNYGHKIENNKQLLSSVSDILKGKDQYIYKRKEFIKNFLYNKGTASKSTLDTIIKLYKAR